MSGKSIRIVAEVTAKTGAAEELWQHLVTLVEPTRKESGNISYEILQDIDNAEHFLFHESWESRDYFADHLASPHVVEYGRVSGHLIAVPVRITVCEARAGA
ncbi:MULTISPECIES: putative quinol monooxygenase [Streptomyces]|uniref:Quinol monooxygenase n=2 Tax=Streptomyces TaxID=1883 RepID=A0ABV9J9G3_9ACTN